MDSNIMKKVLLFLSLMVISLPGFSQIASRLFPMQAPGQDTIPACVVWVDNGPNGMTRMYSFNMAYFLQKLEDTTRFWADTTYLKIADAATVATSGSYTDLSNTPTALSDFTNDMGFLTGVTSSDVTTALGYTPYPDTNPNNYITPADTSNRWKGIAYTPSNSEVISAIGYNPYPDSNPDGFVSDLNSFTTTDLSEGTNLYFTPSRARSTISLEVSGSTPNYNSSTGVISLPNWSFNNSPSRSLVSTVNAANGFQVSSTRNSDVRYSVTINTTVSLSGNATGYVVLEICPTNSATGSDWIEVGRVTSGQSGTLVIGLTLTQQGGGQLAASVPAGWYTRIRTVNTAGSPSYTLNSSQEVLK